MADARNGVRAARTPWELSTAFIYGLYALSKGGIGLLLTFFTIVITTIVPAMCNVSWFEAILSIIADYMKQMLSGGVSPTPEASLLGTSG